MYPLDQQNPLLLEKLQRLLILNQPDEIETY